MDGYCLFWRAGIFVALALRFDMHRGREKTYFTSAFSGYVAGLLVTILVMNWFQAAQVFSWNNLFFYQDHSKPGIELECKKLRCFLKAIFRCSFAACPSVYRTRSDRLFGSALCNQGWNQACKYLKPASISNLPLMFEPLPPFFAWITGIASVLTRFDCTCVAFGFRWVCCRERGQRWSTRR